MNALGSPPSRDDAAECGVFDAIAARAVAADAGEESIGSDLELLAASGLLEELVAACLPGGEVVRGVTLLRRLGRASLAVGRLVEGHLNACKLIALYGDKPLPETRSGGGSPLLGVWGADGDPPVRLRLTQPDGRVTLTGRKRFCSGLGILQRGVVLAETEEGAPQMVLADVTDARRADNGDWKVSGMRATRSGSYDFDGVEGRLLGQTGDFLIEPHFEGGIWRYLALKAGATEALAEAIRQVMRARPERDTALNRDRLLRATAAAHSARLWTEAAARAVEATGADRSVVALPLAAREVVEDAARTALGLADRVLGTASFRLGDRVDLIRRDLGFYLRQADLDGKVDRAAGAILAHEAGVGEQW